MDQTGFTENQEILQAPPLPTSAMPPTEPSRLATKTKKKQKILFISLGTTAFLVILAAMVSMTSQNQARQVQQNLNFVNPNQQSTSTFTQRFQALKNQLDTSDPTDIELAPPPVDYKLLFLPKSNY